MGNQNPYIEEQTTQWPKVKVQKTIYKLGPNSVCYGAWALNRGFPLFSSASAFICCL